MAETAEQDDRPEDPTQRRLDQAIERSDVAKSQEINTLFVLGGLALAVLVLSGPMTRSLAIDLRGFLMNAHLVPQDGAGLTAAGRHALWAWLAAVALPLGLIALAGLAGGGIQHRPLWSAQPLKPQLGRISPLSGAKRVFGREAFVQFVKGLLKILMVGSVAGAVLWSDRDRLDGLARLEPAALLPILLVLAMKFLSGVRDPRLSRPRRRGLSAHGLAQAPAHDQARAQGGVQGNRGQPRDQGAPAP